MPFSFVLFLVLIVAGALCAIAFWIRYAGEGSGPWAASLSKTASTALLAIAALFAGGPTWLVAGLALGSLGDYCLSRPSGQAFLAGMAAFALGHFAYAAGMWPLGAGLEGLESGLFLLTALVMGPMLAATLVWIAPKAGSLSLPVRAYGLIIAMMAFSAALLLPAPGRGPIQLGVALFVLSDMILALGLFVFKEDRLQMLASKTLWPLYWTGQALICMGGCVEAMFPA